jgi:hypothetical protein
MPEHFWHDTRNLKVDIVYKESALLSIFNKREIWSRGWLYLDIQMKMRGHFFTKKSLFLTIKKDIESLLELLLTVSKLLYSQRGCLVFGQVPFDLAELRILNNLACVGCLA